MLSNSSESMFKVESSLGPVSKLTRSSKSYDHFNLQAGSMKGAEIILSLLYPVAITELDLYWLTIKNNVKCGFSNEYERNGHTFSYLKGKSFKHKKQCVAMFLFQG